METVIKYATVLHLPDGSDHIDKLYDTLEEAQRVVDFENHYLDEGEYPLVVQEVSVKKLEDTNND